MGTVAPVCPCLTAAAAGGSRLTVVLQVLLCHPSFTHTHTHTHTHKHSHTTHTHARSMHTHTQAVYTYRNSTHTPHKSTTLAHTHTHTHKQYRPTLHSLPSLFSLLLHSVKWLRRCRRSSLSLPGSEVVFVVLVLQTG